MAQMFGMARQESLSREGELREEIQDSFRASDKRAAALAAQVTHLTSTVSSLR